MIEPITTHQFAAALLEHLEQHCRDLHAAAYDSREPHWMQVQSKAALVAVRCVQEAIEAALVPVAQDELVDARGI